MATTTPDDLTADATAAQPTRTAVPDTRDMVIVHKVFRREFRLAPRMVWVTEPDDSSRRELVGEWLADLVGLLHHHHINEDELVWPRLLARVPVEADLVTTMQFQHAALAGLLERIDVLLPRWRQRGDVESRVLLTDALSQLPAPLVAHLDLEERDVLPLVADHMTASEYGELGERGRGAMDPDKLLLFLGAMLEDATAEEAAMMLGGMPMPARAAWTLVGKRQYRSHVRALRAGC